jgi:hypothetical protein
MDDRSTGILRLLGEDGSAFNELKTVIFPFSLKNSKRPIRMQFEPPRRFFPRCVSSLYVQIGLFTVDMEYFAPAESIKFSCSTKRVCTHIFEIKPISVFDLNWR